MYLVSEKMANLIFSENPYKAKFGEIEDGFIGFTLKSMSTADGCLSLGGTVSTTVEFKMNGSENLIDERERDLFVGMDIDGTTEWILLGRFTPNAPKTQNEITTFTAFDRMTSKMSDIYISSISYPATAIQCLNEISRLSGVPIDTSNLVGNITFNKKIAEQSTTYDANGNEVETTTYVPPFEGMTYADSVKVIAELYGMFAIIDRTGTCVFRWYETAKDVNGYIKDTVSQFVLDTVNEKIGDTNAEIVTIGMSQYYDDLSSGNDEQTVTMISATNGADTFTAGEGFGVVYINNAFVTQEITNSIYSKIKNFSYKPSSFSFMGDPRLSPGDIIRIQKSMDEYVVVPIMSYELEYDGGLKCVVESVGLADNEEGSSNYTYSSSSSVSGNVYNDMVNTSQLIARNANISNARIGKLKADTLVVGKESAEFITAKGITADDGYIKNFVTDNLRTDSINGNKIHNSHILAKALSDEAIETIMGVNVYYRAEAPENPNEGDLWYRTVISDDDKTPTIMYEYINGQWVGTEFDQKVIRANSITAQEIASNTITANQIKSGSITTDKLMIGEVGNLYDLKYDTFEGCYIDPDGKQNVYSYKHSSIDASMSNDAMYGTQSLHLIQNTMEVSNTYLHLGTENKFDTYINVDPNTRYTISLYVKMLQGTSYRVAFIENTGSVGFGGEDGTILGWSKTGTIGEWTRFTGSFTTKDDTKSLSLYIGFNANTTGEYLVDCIQIDKGPATPFKPASFTKIDGSSIQTRTIKGDSIDVEDLFARSIKATGTIDGATLISRGKNDETTYSKLNDSQLQFYFQNKLKSFMECLKTNIDGNDYTTTQILIDGDEQYNSFGIGKYTDNGNRWNTIYQIVNNDEYSHHFFDGLQISGKFALNDIGDRGIYDKRHDDWILKTNNNDYTTLQGNRIDFVNKPYYASEQPVTVSYTRFNSRPTIRPDVSGSVDLGTSNLKWGQIYTNSSVNTSDLKEKEVIEHDWKIDEFIKGLKPITYRSTSDGSTSERLHMGFGAQDVSELCKRLNIGDMALYEASYKDEEKGAYKGEDVPDDQLVWGLKYNEFIAPMVLEMQKLMNRCYELEEKNKELEERLEKLERSVS